jgi:hypothetical protein
VTAVQRIHGLEIRADVALPGIARSPASACDVELELVERLPAPIPIRIRYRAGTPDDVTTRVEIVDDARGLTAFRYGDGTAIDVELHGRPARIRAAIAPGQTLEDLAAYLYGPVLGFLLRAWGRLALHASCVRIGDGTVLIAGASGAGKSTTAAALVERGHLAISDDLTALTLDENAPCAWAAFDHLRLWPEGEQVVLGENGRLDRITPTWDKRRFSLDDRALVDGPYPVHAIVVLRPRRAGARPVPRALAPANAVVTLATLTYANHLLDSPMRARELVQLGAMVRAVPIHTLTPPDGRDGLDALCAAIVRAAASRTPVCA